MTTATAWPVRSKLRQRNRDALLAAAADLLETSGYAGCSLEAVARRAGVTKGAVYSIFGSKAELFLAVLKPRWQAPSFEEVADTPGDLADLLEAYGRRWARLAAHPDARKGLELALELQLAALREPTVATALTQIYDVDRAHLADELRAAAHARNETLASPAEDLLFNIVAALQGLTQAALLLDKPIHDAAFGAVARRLARP